MCIIGLKPLNENDFEEKVLEYCWEKNSDGAGYAIFKDGFWVVRKGFMKYKKFIEAYKNENVNKNMTSIVHFRIGTAGLKDAGNTHPFPITDNKDYMRETEFTHANIAFHNGVVGSGVGIYSDTMEYIADYLFPLLPLWEDNRVSDKIAEVVLTKGSSRWVVCVGASYWKYGTWYDYKGCHFSNSNYKPYETAYTYYPAKTQYWNRYDDCSDPSYLKLKALNMLPVQHWTYGWGGKGAQGFWKSGVFTTWEDYYEEIQKQLKSCGNKTADKEEVQPPKTASIISHANEVVEILTTILSQEAFNIRYKETACTKTGKCIIVMNWKRFALDCKLQKIVRRQKIKGEKVQAADTYNVSPDDVMLALVDESGDVVFERESDEQKHTDEINDMKMCPNCFEDTSLSPSPFTVGDNLCKICGAVFTLATGFIHLFDVDIHAKYNK